MIISYQVADSFKISQGDLTLAVNPKAKVSADITLFTLRQAQGKPETSEKSGFVIDGPGEYEVRDIFIKGFPDKTFLITFEGIKLCFLGTDNQQQTTDNLEDVGILFVRPDAYKTAVALEPSVMIPMDYDKAALTQFLKEAGETNGEPIDKLVVKKKDLEGKEGEVVVLKEE
jgi:hypothetical protein